MMATNDRNDTTRKQVTAIDVNDIQQQKKEAVESAQLNKKKKGQLISERFFDHLLTTLFN